MTSYRTEQIALAPNVWLYRNVAQLVEHHIGYTEDTGSNPVKALNSLQASFFELYKWVIPGDPFITYSSESLHAVQIYDYFMHDYSLIQKDDHDHQSQTRSLPEQVSGKDSPHNYFWQNISNYMYQLCRITRTEPITKQVRRKRWRWIGQ